MPDVKSQSQTLSRQNSCSDLKILLLLHRKGGQQFPRQRWYHHTHSFSPREFHRDISTKSNICEMVSLLKSIFPFLSHLSSPRYDKVVFKGFLHENYKHKISVKYCQFEMLVVLFQDTFHVGLTNIKLYLIVHDIAISTSSRL